MIAPRPQLNEHGAADVNEETRRRLALYRKLEGNKDLQAAMVERWRRDPHAFFADCAWSFNPRSPLRCVPFVPWNFQRDVIDATLGLGSHGHDETGRRWPLVVDKSRDLGLSWLILLCFVWLWLFEPAAQLGVMTRSGTELDDGTPDSLFGKIMWAVERLPRCIRPNYDKRIIPCVLKNLDTGAAIHGSRTVPDAFRGRRHVRTLVDEGAAVPKLHKIMASLHDVTEAPVVVSTPQGRGNHFARIVHGEAGDVAVFPRDGVGWAHIRLHYSNHPQRIPGTPEGDAWKRREQAKRTNEEWQQEQECNYTATAPGRIWPEFDRGTDVLDAETWAAVQRWIPHMRIIEAWDFGSGESLTAVVWAGYLKANDTLYILDYRCWQRAIPQDVALDVGSAGWFCANNPNGRRPHRRLGDVAGKASDSTQRSWLMNLRDEGIDITTVTLAYIQESVISHMRVMMREQKILFAPICAHRHNPKLPSVVECAEQYRRAIKGAAEDHVGGTPKPHKDIFSHLADCKQYIANDAWPTLGGRVRKASDRRHKMTEDERDFYGHH